MFTHSRCKEYFRSIPQFLLGTLKGFEAKIYLDQDAQLKFHRARSVPYALRDKVDEELKRLQEEGTLEA